MLNQKVKKIDENSSIAILLNVVFLPTYNVELTFYFLRATKSIKKAFRNPREKKLIREKKNLEKRFILLNIVYSE